MSNHFKQLKKRWHLPAETSVEALLALAQKKHLADPDDPENLFLMAEFERLLGDTEAAQKHYAQAVKLTDKRTQQRGIQLEQRLTNKRRKLRSRLLSLTLIPFVVSLMIGFFLWKSFTAPEVMPADANPNQFAFTEWLAKQQMVQIMTTLQQQNPELSFDFSRPAANNMTPMEFMQSLLQPDAIGKLKRNKARAANQASAGDGRPAFQCSKEASVHCAAQDIPSGPGEKRREVVLLMEAYRSILDTERDCEKLEKSIETIGAQLHWRKSERRIKADLEDIAVECFFRKKNVEKTIEHARKLQCTGDEGYINSVYWFLTAIYNHAGDKNQSYTSYQCFQEAISYIENNNFSPAYVASRHRESGALAWLFFDDLSTATNELIKARRLLKSIPEKTPTMLEVLSEIDLDLMETYVTANVDLDTFNGLLEEINTSGLLTDGYKQIKDTLAAIYFMQNNNKTNAVVALNNLASRFKLMPEFICGWDWTGFRRGLEDSISDEATRKQAIKLVDLANCYEPKTMEQRIRDINQVIRWLKQS